MESESWAGTAAQPHHDPLVGARMRRMQKSVGPGSKWGLGKLTSVRRALGGEQWEGLDAQPGMAMR